jgi:hypothetical protein
MAVQLTDALAGVAKALEVGGPRVTAVERLRALSPWERYKVNVPLGKSGDWAVVRMVVTPEHEAFEKLRCALNPQRPARFVPAGTYTALTRNGEVIMSDTPDEIRDHMDVIRAAKGHCLVNGLGLGVVAAAMLEKPEVERVTVVELSPDVVALVGGPLKEKYGDRLEVVLADAFAYAPPKGVQYGAVWNDIWDNISKGNLPGMRRLKAKYAGKCEWQGCWQEDGCRGQVKRMKSGQGWY